MRAMCHGSVPDLRQDTGVPGQASHAQPRLKPLLLSPGHRGLRALQVCASHLLRLPPAPLLPQLDKGIRGILKLLALLAYAICVQVRGSQPHACTACSSPAPATMQHAPADIAHWQLPVARP